MTTSGLCTISDIKRAGHELTCTFSFEKKHSMFEDYMPGKAVVPGVCLLHLIKQVLEQETDIKLIPLNAAEIKMLKPVKPGVSLQMELLRQEEGDLQHVKALLKNSSDEFFRFEGTFEPWPFEDY